MRVSTATTSTVEVTVKPFETLIDQDGFIAGSPNAFLERFKTLCDDPAIRAVSFDFFDTVVWRPVRQPTDLFWEFGKRLLAQGTLTQGFSAGKFVESRLVAERHARARKVAAGGFHEVTLEEIYAEFRALSPKQQADACASEVAYEAEMTLADPIIRQAMSFARDNGKQVLIVSNTYLSRQGLATLARGKTPFEMPLEDIYVSCEYSIDKEVGLLPLVLTERGLAPSEVLHVGDNFWADVDISTRAGIHSLHYPKFSDLHPDFLERETRVRAFDQRGEAPEQDVLPQLRRQLLNRHGTTQSKTPSEKIGTYVVGPALAAYAHWLLDEVDRQGPGPVLCLTREGLFLSEIFQSVAEQTGRDNFVSLPFLSSRSIVFSCSFFDFSIEELETFLLSRRTPFTMRTFCALLGLEDIAPEAFGVESAHLDFPLLSGSSMTPVLIAALTKHTELKKVALAYSENNRATFKRYVASAFDRHNVQISNGVIYVADVGWSGRSQRLLERVLQSIGYEVELRGLYMATDHASRIEHMLGLKAKGWLYDGGHPLRSAALGLQSKEIIEQVCSSELGAVRTYDAEGDPVFGQETKSLRQCSELRQLRNAAREAVHQFSEFRAFLEEYGLGEALLKPQSYRDAYAALLTFPSDPEYALFSAWEHEENNLSDNVETLGSNYQKTFASYATPQQFLETHAYWKLPEFRQMRPHLADTMLLKLLGLSSFVIEDAMPYTVTLDGFGTRSSDNRTAYFSQDNRAVMPAVHFCQGGSQFRFRNNGPRPLEVDAVLISSYDTHSRDRFESVLMPDFAEHPEFSNGNRRIPSGDEFLVEVQKPALYAAPISVILCVRRL